MKPRREQDSPSEENAATNSVKASGDRSVAAGRDIGIVTTGDNSINIIQHTEQLTILPDTTFKQPADVAISSRLCNLPRLYKTFVGRHSDIAALNAANPVEGETLVQAICGLGGVGKSTLASHWAASKCSEHTLTWWITADTSANMQAGLASLACALHPPLSNYLTHEALSEWAIQWLSAHKNWLVILDNASEPTLVQPLLSRISNGGRVLITSRLATGWHYIARPVSLSSLSPDEAVLLFKEILGVSTFSTDTGVRDLCEELGYLPLAIEQAAAFCVETKTTPQEYLGMLLDYPIEIYQAGPEGGDSERTISRIWKISLDKLEDSQLAGKILRILAWLSPDRIPRYLLSQLAAPPILAKAIGKLIAHSLVSSDPETGSLSVHRLVQAVIRCESESLEYLDFAASSLIRHAPPDPQHDPTGWALWWELVPHCDALLQNALGNANESQLGKLSFLAITEGSFLLSQKSLHASLRCAITDLEITERLYGRESARLIGPLTSMAMLYQELGDTRLSGETLQRALSISKASSGEDSEQMLSLLASLSEQLRWERNFGQALIQAKRAFRVAGKILPPGHRTWVHVLRMLGEAYCAIRRPYIGIPYLKKALSLISVLDSSNHPHAATILRSLSWAYEVASDFPNSRSVMFQALDIVNEAYGPEHPVVLEFSTILARIFRKSGHYAESLEILLDITENNGFPKLPLRSQSSCLINAAECLYFLGDPDGELAFLVGACSVPRESRLDDLFFLQIEQRIAKIHIAAGRMERSLHLLLQLKDRSAQFGDDAREIYIWSSNEVTRIQEL